MNHFTDDQAYDLAVKITAEAALSPQEEEALMHITHCDDCYHLLNSMMAMLEVARNIGTFAVNTEPVKAIQPVRETIRAVLKLTVGAVNSVLDQITAGANEWTFRRAPTLLSGVRGSGKHTPAKKLTDPGNAKNVVAYDPDRKTLMIQLDPDLYSDYTAAFLTTSDGARMEIPFEQRGSLLWAEATGLADGDYTITLER